MPQSGARSGNWRIFVLRVYYRGHKGTEKNNYHNATGATTSPCIPQPMEIPNVGSYVSFLDPEGNRVSMLEPIPVNWHGAKAKAKKLIGTKKAVVSGSGRKKKAVRRAI